MTSPFCLVLDAGGKVIIAEYSYPETNTPAHNAMLFANHNNLYNLVGGWVRFCLEAIKLGQVHLLPSFRQALRQAF